MSDSAEDLEYKKMIESYSFEDLKDIAVHIDQEKHPQRYEWVLNRIDFLHKNDPNYVDPTKAKNVVEGTFRDLAHFKIKHIFFPFLLLSVGFIAIYSFVNFVFVIKTGWVAIDQDIINLWVPLSLPIILTLLFLRTRLLLLKVENKKGDDRFRVFYYLIATIAIAIPTIIAQKYLETATGKLTALEKIADINNCPQSKYYTVKQYYVDKSHAGADGKVVFTGKHNEKMNFTVFISSPMVSFNYETSTQYANVWFGKIYKEHFNNPHDDALAESSWQSFWKSSISDFEENSIAGFVYLDRLKNCADYRGLEKAAAKTPLYNSAREYRFL